MRRGGRIFIILGFLLALISLIAVFVVLANAEPQPIEVPTTKLVVAFQEVPNRSEVAADQVGQVDWPQKIPTPIGAFEQPSDVIGKLAIVPIYPGQPIINRMIISKADVQEQHSNAALLLEKGKVAVAFPININSDVGEAIQAGDKVDLLVTYSVTTPGEQTGGALVVSQRTLQNVLVLQVGAWPGPGAEAQGNAPANVMTVQLDEQDALVLKQIEQTAASFSLALRAANDDQEFNPEPVTTEYINKRFGFNFPPGAR
jgi:Flp pilus assembly protein CpaB